MKKSLILFLMITTSLCFTGCNSDDDTTTINYVGFDMGPFNPGVEIDGEETVEVMVYTTTETSSAREFGIMVDEASTTLEPEAYSVPQTVTVPGGSKEGAFSVDIYGIDIDKTNGETLGLRLIPANNEFVAEDGLLTIDISSICPLPETILNITFDDYGSETSWEILDENGNVISSGDGYSDGDSNFSASFCLEAGTYTFNIYDSYGDGLTYPNEGSVILTYDGQVLFEIPGDFGSEGSSDFTLE